MQERVLEIETTEMEKKGKEYSQQVDNENMQERFRQDGQLTMFHPFKQVSPSRLLSQEIFIQFQRK